MGAGHQPAHRHEAPVGQLRPPRGRGHLDSGDEGREVLRREDLRLLDHRAVDRDPGAEASALVIVHPSHRPRPLLAERVERRRGTRRGRERRPGPARPDRVLDGQDRRVVDPVVALVQAPAEQLAGNLGGPQELRGEGSHEDVGGQLLDQRQVQVRAPGQRVQLTDEPVGHHGGGERVERQLPHPPQRRAGGAGGAVAVGVTGDGRDPRQLLEPRLVLQVQQQQRAAPAERLVGGGHEPAQGLVPVPHGRGGGGELWHELGQHFGGRDDAALDELLDRGGEGPIDDLADGLGDLGPGGQPCRGGLLGPDGPGQQLGRPHAGRLRQLGQAGRHDPGQGAVGGPGGVLGLPGAQRGVGLGPWPAAAAHHRVHGVLEQPAPPGVEWPPGDRVLEARAQDGQVLLRPAVLGAAGVDRGERPVAVQERRAPPDPSRRDVAGHPAVGDRLQPEREQLVTEGCPHGQRLAHRLEPLVRPPPGHGRPHLADHLTMDVRRAGRVGPGRLARRRREAQPVGEGRQLVEQVKGRRPVTRPQQPRHHGQRRLLGDVDAVPAGVQQRAQLGHPALGQVIGEQRPSLGHQAGPTGEVGLVVAQRATGNGLARREAAPDHLEGDPGGQPLDGRARPHREGAGGHAGEDRRPAAHPLLGASLGRGVLVDRRRGERLGELAERVARADPHARLVVHASVAGSAPAPSGSEARRSAD
jgi:hypothetical protein